MGVTVVEQAGTWFLTTVERVKAELGIAASETDDDAMLADMIDRASSAIARETRRTFGVETVTETLDGSGSRLLALSRTPIIEVTSVTEDGDAIADFSVEDREAGALYRAVGWGRTGGMRMWGTEAFASGYILPGVGASLRYSVTYRAGYALPGEALPYLMPGPDDAQNLPGAVEQACLETVKAWYLARDSDPGISSVQVGQLKVSYRNESSTPPGSLPASALGLLRNYYAGPLR